MVRYFFSQSVEECLEYPVIFRQHLNNNVNEKVIDNVYSKACNVEKKAHLKKRKTGNHKKQVSVMKPPVEEEDDDVIIILDQAASNPKEVTANEAIIIPNENEISGDVCLTHLYRLTSVVQTTYVNIYCFNIGKNITTKLLSD